MSLTNCSWTLADLAQVERRGVTVMSTFACGGGSSLGYKLAGCDVIAANDIDEEMAWHYKENLNPKHYFLCPIRDLLKAELPKELFDLDILDGSPPCSAFSMSGEREKTWGKQKYFREGQAEQVLSDLFFDYLDLVGKLRPRVAIAENVKGMIVGNAKGYAKLVMKRFRELGYRPQLFLINAADCGVPQKRERVFFCAVREDVSSEPLNFKPRHRWISAAEACAGLSELTPAERHQTRPAPFDVKCWHRTTPGKFYKDFVKRSEGRLSGFNMGRLSGGAPSCTLMACDGARHWSECRRLTFREQKRLGSFPDDYVAKNDKIGKYMIGMSVPPRMTEAVARAVVDQWILREE